MSRKTWKKPAIRSVGAAARKNRHADKDENRATAYHEAGHAVLQVLLPEADPLHKVTIIPRQHGRRHLLVPEKDRYGYGLKWLKATMRLACGGHRQEKASGDISSGGFHGHRPGHTHGPLTWCWIGA